MRVVFFATAPIAVPTLQALLRSEHEIVAVVTQPDKPAGRGRHLTPSPIAQVAANANIETLKPPSLKDANAQATIMGLSADIFVVAAYGKLMPDPFLEHPQYKCINLHPSLLPKYRGASPVRAPLLNGDTVTGVTTMYVTSTLDAGDILLQVETLIGPQETAEELYGRLATIGADLIVQTIDGLAADTITPRRQDEAAMTYAPMLTKEDGLIDWSMPAVHIINRVRGLQPWPSAFTHVHGKLLKIFRAEIPEDRSVPAGVAPGTIVDVTRSIQVATGDGRLCLTDLQLEGKKRMPSEVLLRGYTITTGDQLS